MTNPAADFADLGRLGVPDSDFPQLWAETQRFSLGQPRDFAPLIDGASVAFLCSLSPTDPVLALWRWSLQDNSLSILFDPRSASEIESSNGLEPLVEIDDVTERARRERLRESARGLTGFSVDAHLPLITFALEGKVHTVNYQDGSISPWQTPGYAVDPRISAGQIATVIDRSLWLLERSKDSPDPNSETARCLLRASKETESFGLPDFLAAEEFSRHRGHWWSPDGQVLLVQQVDDSDVAIWWLEDSSAPENAPRSIRYPAAGAEIAQSKLLLIDKGGHTTPIAWNSTSYPFLTRIDWSDAGLQISTLSRDQRNMCVQEVSLGTGETTTLMMIEDENWVEVLPGSPRWAPKNAGGRVLHTVDDSVINSRRLALDGKAISPVGFLVDQIIDADDSGALIAGFTEPLNRKLAHVSWSGELTLLVDGQGWVSASRANEITVVACSQPTKPYLSVLATNELASIDSPVKMPSPRDSRPNASGSISRAEAASLEVNVDFLSSAPFPTCIVWPRGFQKDEKRLPVIMAPYGGPHGRRVVNGSPKIYAADQWLADHGFAVVITDGPGTPGQGPLVEKMVASDLCQPAVAGQVAGLSHALETFGDSLDSNRVGIHGWSFGGYLTIAALLLHPEMFHVGVAGAPVTDWALYDAGYSERYLGTPVDRSQNYQNTSLIDKAAQLTRPLLMIHGVADDNVIFAHTLQFSNALVAAGRPHSVLPLSGVTHMTSQTSITANLERLKADFFVTHLLP